MKGTRYTEGQIIGILMQVKGGTAAAEVSRQYGVSKTAIHKGTGLAPRTRFRSRSSTPTTWRAIS